MYVCGDLNLYLFDEPIDHYKLYETKLEELKKNENFIFDSRCVISLTTNSDIEINSLGHWIIITNATIVKIYFLV